MKKIMDVFFFVFLTFCMLTNSSLSLAYAALGLRLWYEKMVPVLFPFMVLVRNADPHGAGGKSYPSHKTFFR